MTANTIVPGTKYTCAKYPVHVSLISNPGNEYINYVIEHQKMRFFQLGEILRNNPSVRVIIAQDPIKAEQTKHDLGTGWSIAWWGGSRVRTQSNDEKFK